jgi:type II secretory pathway component GspD/PulD (secretin)/tetratricopeptide (TPR) repeat protein
MLTYKLKKIHISFAVLAIAFYGAALHAESDVVTGIKTSIGKRTAFRQKFEAEADHLFAGANKDYAKNKFPEAIEKYLEAVKTYRKCASYETVFIKDRIKKCQTQIYQCYFLWAASIAESASRLSETHKFDEAIVLCKKAIKMYPPCKSQMEARIKQYKKQQAQLDYRNKVSPDKIIPDKDNRDYQIAVLLRQGDELNRAGRWKEARNKYEQVIIVDPYNINAVERIRSVNLKMAAFASKRKFATFKNRTGEAVWKGVLARMPDQIDGVKDVIQNPVRKITAQDAIRQKLNNIIIPKITFDEVTVPTAIKYLKETSKQLDPEGSGINIFLRLTVGLDVAAASEVSAADTAADDGGLPEDGGAGPGDVTADDGGGGGGGGADVPAETAAERTITMAISNKSLYEAIKLICQAASLKFRIEKYAVVIADRQVPLDDLETHIYPVEKDAIDSVGGDDANAVRVYFEDRGINFPLGSKIVFDSGISRLIATNTPDNLRRIEEIIQDELNSVDPQVEIQVKFVEITQNDALELGFQYIFARNNNERGSRRWEFDNSENVTRTGLTGRTDNVLTYLGPQKAGVLDDDGWQYAFSVNALDQIDTTDILSSPRIVTMNGQQASIRMITERYFPDEWGEATTATTTSSTTTSGTTTSSTFTTYVSGLPEFADAEEEGITLVVTPEVDADRRTISLNLNPRISLHTGWTDYSYQITINEGETPVTYTQTLKKAEISERIVSTKVSVLDGETIVLGGIISDVITERYDKVPILGELPLIGRLFQSRATQATKTNLLIFLTCRLIKPDGSLLNPDTVVRGKPDFFGRR